MSNPQKVVLVSYNDRSVEEHYFFKKKLILPDRVLQVVREKKGHKLVKSVSQKQYMKSFEEDIKFEKELLKNRSDPDLIYAVKIYKKEINKLSTIL